MKTALGVSWNDAKPRRMSALIALLFATLIAIATSMSSATVGTETHSSVTRTVTNLLPGGNPLTGSGATWS